MLFSAKPKNDAVAAAIARARRLTEFKWRPIREFPMYSEKAGNFLLPAGEEVKGFPYASTERTDRFIGENISVETFLSAIVNPHSKLYQPGHAAYNASNYGIVCNGFVRYAFGIKERANTENWFSVPGMREIKPKANYTVDEMELCDVLYAYGEGRNHVSLITDIQKNEEGKIELVEVSEAVRPFCIRRLFAPEDFYEKFKLFSLCRYDFLDSVPLLDKETDEALEGWNNDVIPKIAVDNGNKSNYREGEEILISVFCEEPDVVAVYRDGELIEEIKIGGRAFVPRKFERGYYRLTLKSGLGEVEFCVTHPEISYEVSDGYINITVNSNDKKSEISHMDFRKGGKWFASLKKIERLTEEECSSGKITRQLVDGAEHFKVYFKNAYGIWTHPVLPVFEK